MYHTCAHLWWLSTKLNRTTGQHVAKFWSIKTPLCFCTNAWMLADQMHAICTPYAPHAQNRSRGKIIRALNETFCGIPICFGTRGQWAMLRFKSKRLLNLSWTRRKLVNRNLNHHKPPKAILQFWTIAWLILSHVVNDQLLLSLLFFVSALCLLCLL